MLLAKRSTLADKPFKPPRRGEKESTVHFPHAFTIVEVLLVLALLALMGFVLAPAGGALLSGARGETAEDTVFAAVREARRQAVLSGREVELRYEAEGRDLVWSNGVDTSRRPISEEGVMVEFLRPVGGAILLGGRLVETDTVRRVMFYPDGTCDFVRLQLRMSGGAPRVIPLDPWTCAPALSLDP